MYGFGISLFPIGANALILWLADESIRLTSLIGRGELLPISIGIVAAAVRDVIATRALSEFASLGITWASFAIIFAAAIGFAAASNPETFNGQNVAEKTVLVSSIVLVFAVLVSGTNAVQSADTKGDADNV